jgi:FAD:protein FMN transferase
MEAERHFRAMGSDVHVVVVGGPLDLLEVARDFIEDLEARWSRFRPASEVSRLNTLAGMPVRVSEPTVALVQRALEGARITAGRFDPTVLGAVTRAGYDRSFELLTDDPPAGRSGLTTGHAGIVVDASASTVTLPGGVGFDPGGIGKGFAADLLVGELLARGAAGACVNVGGDLRVEGEPPLAGSWLVSIEHPVHPEPAAVVGLRSGAVATTTRAKRAWGATGDRRHHLIDPSTGEPAATGSLSATVLAAEGWQAEVLAKAAFLAGPSGAGEVLSATGTQALLVTDDGEVWTTEGFRRFARPGPAGVRGPHPATLEGSFR